MFSGSLIFPLCWLVMSAEHSRWRYCYLAVLSPSPFTPLHPPLRGAFSPREKGLL